MHEIKENKKPTIALTGGFSGGHTYPLLSLYNYFKEGNDYNFVWVGEEDSLEQDTAKKARIKFIPISAGKIRRYFDLRNLYEPLKNLTGIFQGISIILKNNVSIVFSKGGFVSLPLCIAAKILGKKIYIHESDSVGGLSNKIVSKLATKVFYTFPNEKLDNIKHILTGQILNPDLLFYLNDLELEENDKLNVIVIGGSQGSEKIFTSLLKALPDLEDINFQVVLGEKNMGFRDKFKKFSNVLCHDFITQRRLGKILKSVDMAITRGGATTLWELTAFGIHSIIVPLKNSAGDHQRHNAEFFHHEYGSNILDEDEDLDLKLTTILNKYQGLRKAGLNLDGFFKPLQAIEREMDL